MRKRILKGDIVSLLAYTLPIIGTLAIILYSLTGIIGDGTWGTVVYGLTTLIFVGGAAYACPAAEPLSTLLK